jgi:hypothetical protein
VRHRANGPALTDGRLRAVADVVEPDELTAVAGHDRRHAKAAPDSRSDEPRRQGQHAVQHVRPAMTPDGIQRRGILAADAFRPSEVVNGGAEQLVGPRPIVVAQHVDVHLVTPCKPLDLPEKRRGDPLDAAFIDAAGDDPGNPHCARS